MMLYPFMLRFNPGLFTQAMLDELYEQEEDALASYKIRRDVVKRRLNGPTEWLLEAIDDSDYFFDLWCTAHSELEKALDFVKYGA